MPDRTNGLTRDTIFAPATGHGASAISVIRLSGPRAHDVLRSLISGPVPPFRTLARRWIVSNTGEKIDDALVVVFPAGKSFSGEPMAEIHCHGSLAVVRAISEEISDHLECRLAEPGEFARRAFLENRMGLPEAEGLADLIAAETELQRRQAMRIMSGELRDRVESWREQLLHACALVEVTIDWVDEEIPENVWPDVIGIIANLHAELSDELVRAGSAQRMRNGFEVAIIGPPNAGKSSLINYLAGRDAAIVSATPGTTRDIIEVRYDLNGIPVVFLDTAGLRDTDDDIERIGVDRAVQRAQDADLRVLLEAPDCKGIGVWQNLLREDDLHVSSKSDLLPSDVGLAISVVDGAGIEALLTALEKRLSGMSERAGLLSQLRHDMSARTCRDRLKELLDEMVTPEPELIAAGLREAAASLEFVVGRINSETVLDTVFGAFCLGK